MKKVASILVILVLGCSALAFAQEDPDDPMKGPWNGPEAVASQREQGNSQTNAGTALVSLYRKYISPINGSNCPMFPSCSTYGIEKNKKHGFLLGWIMTWDRLYRCGRDELRLSSLIIENGQPKCSDPVHSNDFWWSNGE